MTESELRQTVVSTAQSYLGCNESDGSHKKIIDLYNSHSPLARNYKVQYTDAWCATFVSAVAIKCGLTDIIPTECGCGQQIALFKNLGAWQESDSYRPNPGDVIYYYWSDNGIGDCTGWPDHVGIVVNVSGNTIKVIEGNISNAVGYRNIAVDGRYIRGFGVPQYAQKVQPVYTEGWVKDDTGWWYRYSDGTYPKSQWKKIKDIWYYFEEDGYMAENKFVYDNGKMYYVGENGAMLTKGTLKVQPNGEIIPVDEDETHYNLLGDVTSETYRATLDKLVASGVLKGRGGTGEDLILDMGEDVVRMLVILDRAGVFG